MAERLWKTIIIPIFDFCDVAWHGCGKVNYDALESLRHRAAKVILPNSGLYTKELNATLRLVPLINRRKLHIVLLTRKCLDGSVPPYLNNYINLNASVHSVTTRSCNDIHISRKWTWGSQRDRFISQVRRNLTSFLLLSNQRNPSLIFQGKLKIFFLIS